ncbi:MAG: amidohydrolase family protein, partial [Clostridia bacterium]|nr:amidohydrolase family protein [Clostridia bacterium]
MKAVFYNGKVYIGEETLKEAFLVEDGVITAVGTDAELLTSADTETVRNDLSGRFVCPGFNDSHMHLLNYGKALRSADLSGHTDSLEGMIRYLKAYAEAHPPREGQWLTGRGWNQDYFQDVTRMPDRRDLDAVSTEYPIIVTRACGHACVVNSAALRLAGISAGTKSPEGGTVGMENGEPDGRLYDNAIGLVSPLIPSADREDLKEMIKAACRALNVYGITSVQSDDYGAFPGIPAETVNDVFRELTESGELTVRVYEQANLSSVEELARFAAAGNVTG